MEILGWEREFSFCVFLNQLSELLVAFACLVFLFLFVFLGYFLGIFTHLDQQRRMEKNVFALFDVVASGFVVILISSHINSGIFFKVKCGQLDIVVESLALVLKVEVSIECRVDVLA